MAFNEKNVLEEILKKRKWGVTYVITLVLSAGQNFPLTTQ